MFVGGGGSGGSGGAGGGGGAGGLRNGTYSVTSGQTYSIRVGSGAPPAPGVSYGGFRGGNSSFAGLSGGAGGGWGGAYYSNGQPDWLGAWRGGHGGSGGGGGSDTGILGNAYDSEYGHGGGDAGGYNNGGGGGGASTNGTKSGVNNIGGNGGAGINSSITGENVSYAGGGGGGGSTTGGTASHGGGAGVSGTDNYGINGTAGTGGGGGGGGAVGGSAGGSGIVILSYSSSSSSVSNFTVTPDNGMYGDTFQFNDTSTGSPTSWNYSFLSGGTKSWYNGTTTAAQNLTWIPSTGGNYTVQLFTQNSGGGNYSAKVQYIDVWNWSPASFTGSPTMGASPLLVTFNGSANNATSFYWDLGDTTIVTTQNTTHSYAGVGSYTVKYGTTNTHHSYNWSNQTNYITVNSTVLADFTGTPTTGYMNPTFPVSFVDMSTGEGLYYWYWEFGDTGTSLLQNPSHTYLAPGSYKINLTIRGIDGVANLTRNNYINVSPMGANFTANVTSGAFPLAVQFTDTSSGYPLSWCWTFGDGSAWSNDQNPSHVFASAGSWDIKLHTNTTYESNWSNKTGYILTYYPPNATSDWTSYVITGLCPLKLQFVDGSGNATSYNWSFGDGYVSSDRQPNHTYTGVGTYDVNFTVNNTYSSASLKRSGYVNTTPCASGAAWGLLAQFVGAPRSGYEPLNVSFTDLSTGNPTVWNWSFGDGTYSNTQHPFHNYTAAGIYTVALNASIATAFDVNTRAGYIEVWPTTVDAHFVCTPTFGFTPLAVWCNDLSTGHPTIWDWNFGDGTAHSSLQNPTHTYTTVGNYTVAMSATSPDSSDSETRSAYISVWNATTLPGTGGGNVTNYYNYTIVGGGTEGGRRAFTDSGDGEIFRGNGYL